MAGNVEKYAEWLVNNKDKAGTPEFNTVAEAYKQLRASATPAAPVEQAIPEGDWSALKNRLDTTISKAKDMGPTRQQDLDIIAAQEAQRQGQLYGQQRGAGESKLVQGAGRAMDKFALGIPRLAEAYLGQGAVPGAVAHEFLKGADAGRATVNPKTALAGDIGGIVGQVATLPVTGGATMGARALAGAKQAAAIGAGESAVSSRGNIGQTAMGGVLGAAFGGAGSAVGDAAIKAGRLLVNPLRGLAKSGPAGQQATARILLAAKNAGIDENVARAKLAELGPDGFIADVLGKQGEGLARTSANLSPDARSILETASKQRLGGQTDRVIESLRKAGRPVFNDPELLKENMRAAARPAINKAYESAKAAGYDMPRAPFDDILGSPKVQGAINQATKEIKDRVAAFGPEEASQLAVYDAAKKILDRMGWKEGDDVAKVLAKRLRDAVDSNIPEYGGARALAQGLKKSEEAADLGVTLATKPQINPGKLVAASSNPRTVAQTYAATQMNKVANRKVGQNALDMLTGTKAGRETLQAALGKDAKTVMRQIDAERKFLGFDRALSGNSTTARQLVELGLVTGAGAGAGYITGFDPMSAGTLAGMAALGRRGAGKLAQALAKKNESAVAPEVARKLIEQTLPKLTDKSGKPITETARRRLVEALIRQGSRGGALAASQ